MVQLVQAECSTGCQNKAKAANKTETKERGSVIKRIKGKIDEILGKNNTSKQEEKEKGSEKITPQNCNSCSSSTQQCPENCNKENKDLTITAEVVIQSDGTETLNSADVIEIITDAITQEIEEAENQDDIDDEFYDEENNDEYDDDDIVVFEEDDTDFDF